MIDASLGAVTAGLFVISVLRPSILGAAVSAVGLPLGTVTGCLASSRVHRLALSSLVSGSLSVVTILTLRVVAQYTQGVTPGEAVTALLVAAWITGSLLIAYRSHQNLDAKVKYNWMRSFLVTATACVTLLVVLGVHYAVLHSPQAPSDPSAVAAWWQERTNLGDSVSRQCTLSRKGTARDIVIESSPPGALIFLGDASCGIRGEAPWHGVVPEGVYVAIAVLDGAAGGALIEVRPQAGTQYFVITIPHVTHENGSDHSHGDDNGNGSDHSHEDDNGKSSAANETNGSSTDPHEATGSFSLFALPHDANIWVDGAEISPDQQTYLIGYHAFATHIAGELKAEGQFVIIPGRFTSVDTSGRSTGNLTVRINGPRVVAHPTIDGVPLPLDHLMSSLTLFAPTGKHTIEVEYENSTVRGHVDVPEQGVAEIELLPSE